MKDFKVHKAYGKNTNVPKVSQVYLIEILQGNGDTEDPIRPVHFYFNQDWSLIEYTDRFKHAPPPDDTKIK